MKPKQLAHVLVKVLGLSLCAHGIPALLGICVSGIMLLIQAMRDGNPSTVNHYPYLSYSMVYWLAPLLEFAIGAYLLLRAGRVVEKMFSEEIE